MSIDISKLTPAPWYSERRYANGAEIVPRIHCKPDKNRECGWIANLVGSPYLGYESTLVNAEFIALARNFADVCERRGWSVKKTWPKKQWITISELDNTLQGPFDNLFDAWQAAIDYDAYLVKKYGE